MSEAVTETQQCPMCGEPILAVAKKCKHCGSMLDGSEPVQKVAVASVDPFADLHAPIAGKKKGKLTLIGKFGVGLGVLFLLAGIAAGNPGFLLFAGIFGVGSYLWVRR
jgi:rubredoxin